MGLIYNATNEEQSVKALGNWFSFKPGQIKAMEDKTSHFIAIEKREHGLVGLPEEFSDPQYLSTEEGKAKLAEAKEQGVKAYIDFHRKIIANNQISMRQDLERANIKADPAAFASDGEIRSMELVAKYQRAEEDKAQQQVDRVKELMKQVNTGAKK